MHLPDDMPADLRAAIQAGHARQTRYVRAVILLLILALGCFVYALCRLVPMVAKKRPTAWHELDRELDRTLRFPADQGHVESRQDTP